MCYWEGFPLNTPVMKEKDIQKKWYIIDATDVVLGRLATKVARILSGKDKPEYVSYIDVGDFVIITNIDKIKLTGNKWADKIYYRHSGYPGGLKQINALDLSKKHPDRIITHAVRGMLPNNKLRTPRLKKMKLIVGSEHNHFAQKPEVIEL